jgi:ribonuclease-3
MVDLDESLLALGAALGHAFADPQLLLDALTHSSYRNEKSATVRSDNERLEFLGDAVLQWIVSTLIWAHFPSASAGEMTRRRADLVCETGLARLARELGIGNVLRLGKGEERSGGRDKPRLLASALEAVVAAVYLDAGTEAALRVCRNLFSNAISAQEPGARDFKTRLQELLQSQGHKPPSYETAEVIGPPHARSYRVVLRMDSGQSSEGTGRSKLEAEQSAAEQAFVLLATTGRAEPPIEPAPAAPSGDDSE